MAPDTAASERLIWTDDEGTTWGEPLDVQPRNYRPGRRDILVAHLIDLVARLGSPTLREVVTKGTKRALQQAVAEPTADVSEVFSDD